MNEIMRRIEILRLDKNVKAVAICNLLGISKSTYSTWKSRGLAPEAQHIPLIADMFGVSCDYLLTGKETSLTTNESELLASYGKLNEEGKQLLKQRADELYKLGYIKSGEIGVVGA